MGCYCEIFVKSTLRQPLSSCGHILRFKIQVLEMMFSHQNNVSLQTYIKVDNYSGLQANGTSQPSGTPLKNILNLLEIHEIGSVDTSESKQQNYDQI